MRHCSNAERQLRVYQEGKLYCMVSEHDVFCQCNCSRRNRPPFFFHNSKDPKVTPTVNFSFWREEREKFESYHFPLHLGHWSRTKLLLFLPEFLEWKTGLKVGDPITKIVLMDRNR